MGGEPLCEENIPLTSLLVLTAKASFPDIKIYLWTGYTYEELTEHYDPRIETIFNHIDYLIDGPFILAERPQKGNDELRKTLSAQGGGLADGAHGKTACARFVERMGNGHESVAVGIRLDDRHEIRRVSHASEIAHEGGKVDVTARRGERAGVHGGLPEKC